MPVEDKNNENQEEELVPVGEGVEDEQPESKDDDEKDGDQGDDDDEGDDDEEDDDERLGASEDDDDDKDSQKEKRRQSNRARRKRKKESRERDRKELTFLRQRNEDLERRFSAVEERVGHSEVSQIDTRINDTKSKIKLADQVISKAIASQDGDAYTEAQGIRDDLRDTLTRLNYAKATMTARTEEQTPPDARLVANAQAWVRDHEWWDPNGGDQDSRMVSLIDAQLVNEGYDPTSKAYWDELSDRVKEALPHRYEDDDDDDAGANGAQRKKKGKKKKPSGGPTMSAGGQERPLKKNEVYISAERKQAMIEAGVWDDPELRQKYLRSYAKYDREAAQNA